MTLSLILFFFLALIAIGSAAGMLSSRNTVYSALFLVINFVTIAIFYLLLSAPFIALAQVAVYAGAIMVLFLFVIMLLGTRRVIGGETMPWQRPLAIVLALALVIEAFYIVFFGGAALPELVAVEATFGSPADIGEVLFTQYLLPFEVTSVLLLVAMIGAIVLTKKT